MFQPPPTNPPAVLLARKAFDTYVLRRDTITAPKTLPPELRRRAGVFVSTMRHGAPRCCMGSLYPLEPDAAHEIIANAVAAAGRDHRFPPVRPAELRGLTLIVSFVSNPRSISERDLGSLDPTRDGLAVRFHGRTGVVLSGETGAIDTMLRWARIRAGAPPGEAVELLRIDVIRFVERK